MSKIWLSRYLVDLDDGQVLDLSYKVSSLVLKECRVRVGDLIVFVKEGEELWYGLGFMEVRSVIVGSLRDVDLGDWGLIKRVSEELKVDWYGIDGGKYLGGWDREFNWWNWVKPEDGLVEVVSFCGQYKPLSMKLGFVVKKVKRVYDKLRANQVILLDEAVEINEEEVKFLKRLTSQSLMIKEVNFQINQN